MIVCSRRAGVFAAVVVFGASAVAAAQPAPDRRGWLGVKAGINYEQAEDGLTGTTGAGGVAGGLSFGRTWTAEVELWMPRSLRDDAGEPKHRDVLFSVSIVRSFGASRLRPYALAGLSTARTEDHLTTCVADRVPPPPLGIPDAVPTIVDCSEPDVRERRRERFTSTSGYLLAGAGAEVPLGRRLFLTPEVRVHFAVTSIILRPSVGLMLVF